jgi:hypothetical protein
MDTPPLSVLACGARAVCDCGRLVSGRARVSRCRRHFPDRADGHSSQARPEGEGLLSRVHDKADDEIIAKSLS